VNYTPTEVTLTAESVHTPQTVPEPGSLASLMGGLGMLLGLQRFRRQKS
jgi:PEP-CTERM motif